MKQNLIGMSIMTSVSARQLAGSALETITVKLYYIVLQHAASHIIITVLKTSSTELN